MLIYDTRPTPGDTWLYCGRHPSAVLGSSMVYWRNSWLERPFPRVHTGEDTSWQLRMSAQPMLSTAYPEPRMVATIHHFNTGLAIAAGYKEWRRAPRFDEYCRGVLAK